MLFVLAFTEGSLAAEPDQCAPFTVYSDGSERVVTYVDHAPSGKSPGDQRVGYRTIKDDADEKIGEFRWIATVVEVAGSNGGKDQTSSEGVFMLPAGSLYFVRPPAPTFVMPEKTDTVAGRGNYIVLGGSGVFRGARGEVTRDGSIDSPFAFDIRCD